VVELRFTAGESGDVGSDAKPDRAVRTDPCEIRLHHVARPAPDRFERGRLDPGEFVEAGDATVVDSGRVEGSTMDVHVRMDLLGEVAPKVPDLPLAHLARATGLGEHRVPNVDQTAPVDGYTASTYGDRFADVYDDWYSDITDADATAELVGGLAEQVADPSQRVVLELGVGTGRLALPMQARGLRVIGVDASDSMLDQLRAKPGGDGIELHAADLGAMDALDLGPVGVALLAFNTLFNLTTEAAQLACLTRCGSWLADDGSVVVEAFVPADDLAATGRRLEPTRITADEVVLTVSEVLADGHSVHGQHIHVRESGIRLRPWQLRVLTPTELDALCERAGLALTARWGGWHHEPFGPDTDRHVSIYRAAR
jgi:SAM-dependent methyltransferase